MGDRPTIEDVARRAGVTKSTVSHVYSGHRSISSETIKKVTEAAAELGWMPNQSAKALAESRANAIGIVMARNPDVLYTDAFFPVFLSGVESVFSQTETALVLQTVSDRESEERAYRLMSLGRVDGFIILDIRLNDWRVKLLEKLNTKAVLMDSGNSHLSKFFSTVWMDDRTPMREIIQHLKELGHQRIAHVSGPLEYVHASERAQSYLEQIGGDKSLLREGDFTAQCGAKITHELLLLPEPPTAIIYANDVMAIAGLSYAESQGLSIPDDLAIVGYEDDPISCHLNPPMTSVFTNAYERGRLGAERLLNDINGGVPMSVQSIPEQVRWRTSTEG